MTHFLFRLQLSSFLHMRCTAWIVFDKLKKITSLYPEKLLVKKKRRVECTAVTVTLHCTSWVPGLGCVFSQGDAVMPQLIILKADLKAGNLVIRGFFSCLSPLYKQAFTSPFIVLGIKLNFWHVCEGTTLAKGIHLFVCPMLFTRTLTSVSMYTFMFA